MRAPSAASRWPAVLALLVIVPACTAQSTPAVATRGDYLIVANQRAGVATLVELGSGRVTDADLGANPHEVAVSPDARLAVLTIPSEGFRSGHTVRVLDAVTARVVRTIELQGFREPHGVAFVNDSVALIGALGGTAVAYVDVRHGRVLRSIEGLPPNPYIVALGKPGRGYVSSPHSSSVAELDVADGRVLRTLLIPDDPAGITATRDGRELYAAVWREGAGGGIAVYDLRAGRVSMRLPATQPRRMAVTADDARVVVSDRDALRIIDRATRLVRTVDLGSNVGGSGVACSPDSARCYVALSSAGAIVEVDIASAAITRRFAARRGVDGLAYVSR